MGNEACRVKGLRGCSRRETWDSRTGHYLYDGAIDSLGQGAPGPMMRTRMQSRYVMAALAVLATALAPGSAAATCAGARSNLAFIQQRIGAIRAETRTAGANEIPQGARQELARWAAV